jgi:transposase, IS5 family
MVAILSPTFAGSIRARHLAHTRRNHLKGRDGDRINAVLAAAGYNFSLLRRWFTELLRALLWILCRRLSQPHLA